MRFHVIVDYAPCRHSFSVVVVSVVIDGTVINYADTTEIQRILTENFEGFSQILKEQSDKKSRALDPDGSNRENFEEKTEKCKEISSNCKFMEKMK